MGLKTRLSSHCTKRANNGVNLVTSRKVNTRLARPIATSLQTVPMQYVNFFVMNDEWFNEMLETINV